MRTEFTQRLLFQWVQPSTYDGEVRNLSPQNRHTFPPPLVISLKRQPVKQGELTMKQHCWGGDHEYCTLDPAGVVGLKEWAFAGIAFELTGAAFT